MFKRKRDRQSGTSLSTEALSDAERSWIENSQRNLECEKLFNSLKSQLNLFMDENGLRHCGGRLANSDIPYSTKSPLIALKPPSHSNNALKCVLHNGVLETLMEIRMRFWIVDKF